MGERWRCAALLAAVLLFANPGASAAQPGGVQWSPDGTRLFVNKDVGAERWAIEMNLEDLIITGNVFFADGRSPLFLWCSRTSHNHQPSVNTLVLNYLCFGSDSAQGAFSIDDWAVISENVPISATFFAPQPETCDLSSATNGPGSFNAQSRWDCTNPSGSFWFQAFDDGSGFSSVVGPFQFDLQDGGCGFGARADGVFFHALYSPNRNLMTLYETNSSVTRFLVSECRRVQF